MLKSEAQSKYCNFYVYYHDLEGKSIPVCVCKDESMAKLVAKSLALTNKEGYEVGYTNCGEPGMLVPGGGWYVSFKRNSQGKLETFNLG